MREKLIPERLISIRETRGLSIPEAAKLTGIDKTAFWRYEQGTVGPSDAAIRILALYLDTSVEYLTGTTDDPTPTIIPVDIREYPGCTELLLEFKRLGSSDKALIIALIKALLKHEKS